VRARAGAGRACSFWISVDEVRLQAHVETPREQLAAAETRVEKQRPTSPRGTLCAAADLTAERA